MQVKVKLLAVTMETQYFSRDSVPLMPKFLFLFCFNTDTQNRQHSPFKHLVQVA